MRRARLPTRVSNACDRCRRQKQRCDDFRPCSNCVHARSDCTESELPPTNKKARLSKGPASQNPLTSPTTSHVETTLFPQFAERHEGASSRAESRTPQVDRPAQSSNIRREQALDRWDEPHRERSVLADLGGSESAMGITKKILGYAVSPSTGDRATYAIPGGDSHRLSNSTSVGDRPLPISHILGIELPSREVTDALVDTYFYTVHWFSLVVYEPKFRVRYTSIMDSGLACPSDRAFLLLLTMILVMGCWYGPDVLDAEIASTLDLTQMRRKFLGTVRQSFMDLMDEECLEFVQVCALLGSYWLYWGRPRSAFSILGAATKSAQALELHRDSDKRFSLEDAEEGKRVWWTIYTWDRFATIVYGRPFGINDKDCNVSMPGSYLENINFISGVSPVRICLSPYQIQLNKIYRIASPLLENIYGFRYSIDRSLRSQMPSMVSRIDGLLRSWQDELPAQLHLDKHDDIGPTTSAEDRMHRLQGLSLQLTYDNLMIVIHRPLLADQSRNSRGQNVASFDSDHLQEANNTNKASFQQCLNSALRISKLQQEKRNLLASARRTHLVSFIGMNLFTSSVVLFICALSDTLSDVAQEAKRGMARNLKMLKLLSGDGSLSMQCSVILEDLVQKIVDKEKEEMLRSVPNDDELTSFLPTRRSSYAFGPAGVGEGDVGSQTTMTTSDEPDRPQEALQELSSLNHMFSVQKTMASLQKVFKDVATPKVPFPSTATEFNHSHEQYIPYGEVLPYQQSDTRLEQTGFTFDGSNFTTGDLGQFWLWDMDPHIEDGSSS